MLELHYLEVIGVWKEVSLDCVGMKGEDAVVKENRWAQRWMMCVWWE